MTPNNPNPQHEHGGEEIQNPGKDFTHILVCHSVVSYCELLQLVQDAPGDSDTRGVTNDETVEINILS